MKVGCARNASVAGLPDDFTLAHVLANLDVDFIEVRVDGCEAVVMDQLYHPTQAAAGIVAGVFDHAVGGCVDRGAGRGPKIDPAVQAGSFRDRVVPHSETAGHVDLHQRLAARHGCQQQLFLKRRVTGNRNSFSHRQRG